MDRVLVEKGIYRRGSRYEAHVHHDGRREQATCASLTEARKWRRARQVDLDRGGTIAKAGALLGPTLDAWLREHGRNIKDTTRRNYGYYGGYWRAELGSVPLRKLTAAMVAEALECIQEGRASKTGKEAIALLRQFLKWAVDRELVSRNVALKVERPKVERHEIQPLTPDQARLLDVELVNMGAPYGTMLRVALWTITRVESEWGAMRWRDVDLGGPGWRLDPRAPIAGIEPRTTTGTNTIVSSGVVIGVNAGSTSPSARLVRMRNAQNGTIRPAGSPKNKRRVIPLPAPAVEALETQRRWQFAQRNLTVTEGEPWDDSEGLVFTNQWGEPVPATTLRRHFKKAAARVGINPEVRIHDLRHTGATLRLLLGMSIKEVQELGGWSNAQVLMDTYAHVVPGMRCADPMVALLAPQERKEAM